MLCVCSKPPHRTFRSFTAGACPRSKRKTRLTHRRNIMSALINIDVGLDDGIDVGLDDSIAVGLEVGLDEDESRHIGAEPQSRRRRTSDSEGEREGLA